MGKIARLGLVLFVITAVTGMILGAVYTVTLEPIHVAKSNEKNEALAATLPGAADFKEIKPEGDAGTITEIYEGSKDGAVTGYNFTVTPKGYGGLITLIVGISGAGEVEDIKILSHSETPGLGAKAGNPEFSGQFHKKAIDDFRVVKTPPEKESDIQAISGATITSTAVTSGVNEAAAYWKAHFSEASEQKAD